MPTVHWNDPPRAPGVSILGIPESAKDHPLLFDVGGLILPGQGGEAAPVGRRFKEALGMLDVGKLTIHSACVSAAQGSACGRHETRWRTRCQCLCLVPHVALAGACRVFECRPPCPLLECRLTPSLFLTPPSLPTLPNLTIADGDFGDPRIEQPAAAAPLINHVWAFCTVVPRTC